jgi:hypothetical protein
MKAKVKFLKLDSRYISSMKYSFHMRLRLIISYQLLDHEPQLFELSVMSIQVWFPIFFFVNLLNCSILVYLKCLSKLPSCCKYVLLQKPTDFMFQSKSIGRRCLSIFFYLNLLDCSINAVSRYLSNLLWCYNVSKLLPILSFLIFR